jgi:autoinducer 2 (AI-2) kinase
MGIPIGNITFSPILANGDPERGRHVARAVLEGLVYGVQANIEQLLDVAGIDQPPIKLAGGIARSDLFAQILSNVSSTTVAVPATTEASALGAAMCAAVGSGVYDDLGSASRAMTQTERTFSPRAEHGSTYRQLFGSWKELRDSREKADLLAGDMALGALLDQTADIPSSDDPHFRPRILVTAQISEGALDSLREIGDVEYQDYRQDMRLLSGEDLVEALNGYHVLVTEIDIVDAEALVELPDLRLVVSCRGNPVNVDIEACTKLGIPVMNTPGRNADAVADLTVAFMLMLARSLPAATQFLRQEGIEAGDFGRMGMAYEEFQGRELWSKKFGLVGLGLIGRKVARRLLPFGAHILVYDPYLSLEDAILAGVELVSLDRLLVESDYVSLHAPVTSETRDMIGAAQLGRMKKGAYLINTARAALLDEKLLYESLASGHLAGAALDVFSVEPPGSEHPLLSLPNVIATPHIAGNTHEVAAHQGKIVKEDIDRLIKGGAPAHVLNPITLQNFSWTAERKPLTQVEREALTMKPGPGVSDLEIETRSANDAAQGPDEVKTRVSTPVSGRRGGLLSKVRDLMTASEKEGPQMKQTTGSTQVTANLERILLAFLDFAIADQALQEFSNNKDFTMVFLLTDSKQEFYLRFDNGAVTGDLTQPGNAPDLTLKMKADILDGMFTGRINPTRAAMTGKIAFSGDTRRAMAMQKIQKDLSRCYSRAREQVGDPGDLASLSAEAKSASIAAPPPAAAPSTPAALSTVGDERDEIIPVLNELYTAGLITSTGGNISLRTSQDSGQVWITPSQIFKGDLRADMMVRIDMAGEQLDDEALPASSERLVHCAVYRNRPDLNAIVHTHAPNTTILMLAGLPFVPISTEAAFVGEIPVVPFIMPGTNDLGDAVADAIGGGVAVFMQNHGLVVGGSSLRRAADVTEIIETTAEKLLLLHLLGVQPPPLPDDILDELSGLRDLMA